LPKSFQDIRPSPRPCVTFRNKLVLYGEELSAPSSTPNLEDHPLPAVRDCLFNIFVATLQIWEAVSSIHNPKTSHTVVTGTHATWSGYRCKLALWRMPAVFNVSKHQ